MDDGSEEIKIGQPQPKEELKPDRALVNRLFDYRQESREDRQGAELTLNHLLIDCPFKAEVVADKARIETEFKNRVREAAHNADHFNKDLYLLGQIVSYYEKDEKLLPKWLKWALVVATVKHDEGAIPVGSESEGEAYIKHELKSAALADKFIDSLEIEDIDGLTKDQFKQVVGIFILATNPKLNCSQTEVENLPLTKAFRSEVAFPDMDTNRELVKHLNILGLTTETVESKFMKYVQLGTSMIATSDLGSYLVRKTFIRETMALWAELLQVWDSGGELKSRYSQQLGDAIDWFSSDFIKQAFELWQDYLPPDEQQQFLENMKIRDFLEVAKRDHNPGMIRLEGFFDTDDLNKIAESLGLINNPVFKTAQVEFSNQLLKFSRLDQPGFGPMATPVIKTLFEAAGPERQLEVWQAIVGQLKLKADSFGFEKFQLQFSPGAYALEANNLDSVIAIIKQQLPKAQLFLGLRQDQDDNQYAEKLVRIAGQNQVKLAIGGECQAEQMSQYLTTAKSLKSEDGPSVYIHWGVGEAVELEGCLENIAASQVNCQFHVDDGYQLVMDWAEANRDKWETIKTQIGGKIIVSPYNEIAQSENPAGHEFFEFYEWAEKEGLELQAVANNVLSASHLGLPLQKLCLDMAKLLNLKI